MTRVFHRGENKIIASKVIKPKHYVDLPDEEAQKIARMFPCILISEDDNTVSERKAELAKIEAEIEAKKKEMQNLSNIESIEPIEATIEVPAKRVRKSK